MPKTSCPSASLCLHCRGRHDPLTPCPCYRCGYVHSGDCGSECNATTGVGECLICGAVHAAHLPCPCYRCGYRHEGDCVTVCSRCKQCHRPNQRVCRLTQVTSSRRVRARIENIESNVAVPRVEQHSLGAMSEQCPHCLARFWPRETINCCRNGDIVIPELNEVPAELADLILCPRVRQNIRSFNSIMAFASTGHENKSFVDGTFVLGGRAYHRIGSILPSSGQQHSFAQIYILDTEDATQRRQSIMPTLNHHLLSQLHVLMMRHNRLAVMIKNAVNDVAVNELQQDAIGLTWSATEELSRFEVGAIIVRDGFQRQISLRFRDGVVRNISDTHQLYHALAYPLLFPTGCPGWHPQLQHNNR